MLLSSTGFHGKARTKNEMGFIVPPRKRKKIGPVIDSRDLRSWCLEKREKSYCWLFFMVLWHSEERHLTGFYIGNHVVRNVTDANKNLKKKIIKFLLNSICQPNFITICTADWWQNFHWPRSPIKLMTMCKRTSSSMTLKRTIETIVL